MPTYDYRCPNGHDFERFFRKISDASGESPCPQCGAVAERRVSGGAGLVFKGSGFYLTDYGKNAHRKSGSDGAASKSDSSGDAAPAKAESTGDGGTASKSESSSTSSAKSEPSKAESKSGKPAAKPKGGDA